MSEKISAPKGMLDILPENSGKWTALENVIRDICGRHGFEEIRTPVVEHTEVFSRGVGDTTDVVSKEMYTFEDKGGRSITLRPEGTAGVVRSFLENGLFNAPMPVKLFYLIGCYRYEKPQKGRLREFHQFGVEMFGATDPMSDATLISLPHQLFERLGVSGVTLHLNSIGCRSCRAEYRNKLRAYFEDKKDKLCPTCLTRLEKNPMRILDCKDAGCKELGKEAPLILDHICSDCADHFEKVQSYLGAMNIPFEIDARIVRGLDYYNRTVFEFVSTDLGAQSTVCGGGRYDGMTEQLGGEDFPGIGFAMGMERFLLMLESQGITLEDKKVPDLYIAPMGEAAKVKAAALVAELTGAGAGVVTDLMGKSLKAQMKYASKIGARHVIVLGDGELESGKITLKDMNGGEPKEIALDALCAADVQ
ncbi:MAG: histidine--tRNA ligase [Clostridia bacterium]|nr:histidine--tRNA ligase [Clostridia bacterium]